MFWDLDKKPKDKIAAIDDSGRSITYGEICEFSIEFAKHHFTLLYPNDLTNAEGVLNLTLIDMVADPTVSRYKNSYEYQAFDLRHIISEFKAVNGKLNTIRVSGMVNKNSCDPEDGSTTTESVDVPYNPLRWIISLYYI